jgi:outer membrane lipoprotein SlyB
MKIRYLALALSLVAVQANADDSTLDAAIGGGIGGAAGAAVGNEVGGRDGAILGGALGAAVGVAVGTDAKKPSKVAPTKVVVPVPVYEYNSHPQGRFCPPGQAKKGRC